MTYLVLISIPMSIGVILNRFFVLEYENHIKLSNIAHLSQTKEIMETYLTNIKWSTYQIAGTARLNLLLNESDFPSSGSGEARNMLLKNLVDELNSYLLYHTSFDSTFYIYFNKADIILTPYSVYKHADFDDSKTFFRMDTITSGDWHRYITSQYFNGKILPARSLIIEDFKNKQMIPYLQSIPVNLSSKADEIDAVIVYLLGETDVHKVMNNTNLPPGGLIYIADENNIVISILGNGDFKIPDLPDSGNEGMTATTLNGEKALFIYTISSKTGWKYVSILPEDIVLEKVRLFQIISFLGLLISLVICLSTASYISNRWAKPLANSLKTIRSYLGTDASQKFSYNQLTTTVSTLVHKSTELQDQARSQSRFIQNAFIDRVLHGFFGSHEQLKTFTNYLNLDIGSFRYCTALVKLWGYDLVDTAESIDELQKTKILLKSVLEKKMQNRILVGEDEDTVLSVLLLLDEKGNGIRLADISGLFSSFNSEISEFYTSGMTIAVGKPADTLFKVNTSYIQAREALDTVTDNSGFNIIMYEQIEEIRQEYYFPIDLEARMLVSIKAGNTAGLENVFDIIISENMEKRDLKMQQLQNLYDELAGSLIKLKNQLPENITGSVNTVYENDSPDLKYYENIFSEYCRTVKENKKSHNIRLINRITEFIEKNYNNFNLGLFMVATEFSITESYLSHFFKEQTGLNFSNFIEKTRIEKATELLKNTGLQIYEISKAVGYSSDKTFRRVFRKYRGISPSEFRQDLSIDRHI